ncbi:family 43 glycosylhydrolase [Runella sp.]|uniref:family 43 glycosylhydrolase n=1 Tax=Runella sp. TaxID=1960881 RepID=UPI003D119C33
MKKLVAIALCFVLGVINAIAQLKTYCNPMNLDYGFTPIPNFSEAGRHRATADPLIVNFKGKYFLFSTNQWGYWWSDDLSKWNFVSRKFLLPHNKVYDELCAPAAWVMGDTLYVIGSTHTKEFAIWKSTNPIIDDWKIAVPAFEGAAWDPGFLYDDDKRLYLYYGSSNTYPLYGWEINPKTLQPIGERKELVRLHDDQHGWERFGDYNDNIFLKPFIEGAWVDKHNGKYYFQYGAPGTEFNGYADGVYVSDKPLGPFTYQKHNPFCYKPGGFIRGSGHGGSFKDNFGSWWHITTGIVTVKNNFERRLVLFPTGFDNDGIMYSNTTFGDYPHTLPNGKADHLKSRFTGWMLLNYNKPVQVSSSLSGFTPNYAVDEDIKTYWSAATANKGEWIQSDLGAVSTVNAIQINYADQDVDSMYLGKFTNIYHQYKLWHSPDGKKWHLLVDKSQNRTDVPHDYIELPTAVETRYIKLENIHMATGKFAISGLRVFGKGKGVMPKSVKGFIILRQEDDKRNAWLKWYPESEAQGYNIHFGIAPDKLYSSIMVYGKNEYYLKALDKSTTYYFSIEPFNENGSGQRTEVMKVE